MYDTERKYTLEDYRKLTETFPEHKYEYVDGDIRMMTGGSLAHAQIEANVARVIGNGLVERECNVYGPDAVLRLSDQRCYCPDASVSCDPADWTRKEMESPTVVVEIISPKSEKTDRGEKLHAYQYYPTIQEILLIDSRSQMVEHHHRIGPSKWELSICTQEKAVIELESIDVSLSMKDIYHKVHLELENG